MDNPETAPKRPRLNPVTRAQRRVRIFARLREGWAYDEIAREHRISAERVRQIVSETLGHRVIDRGEDHAHLQLTRLAPALKVTLDAVGRGEFKAVTPLIKVLDRLDKHQVTMIAKYTYGEEEREKLLAKINGIVLRMRESGEGSEAGGEAPEPGEAPHDPEPLPAGGGHENIRLDSRHKSLKRLDSDEGIQGIPRKSNSV